MQANESFLCAFLRPYLGDSTEQVALDDQIWMDWITADGEPRDQRDFLELLDSDARDVFKMRGCAVLISPDLESCNFLNAPDQDLIAVNVPCPETFSDESETLYEFLGKLTCCCFDFLASCDRGSLTDEQMFMEDYYPRLICELLEMLPADHPVAEELFERFPFLRYTEDEFAFLLFMESERIPDEWKIRLDHKMRRVIDAGLKEEDPKVVNLSRKNNLIKHYIQSLHRSDVLVELWSSQIGYLLDLPLEGIAQIFFEGQDCYEMYDRLKGNEHRPVRRILVGVLAREHLLEGLFSRSDFRSRNLASLMRQDVTDIPEIVSLLDNYLEQCRLSIEEPRREDAQRRERITAALDRMQ